MLRFVARNGWLCLILSVLVTDLAPAATLKEHAASHELKLFIATRGAVMPNAIDQTNNLAEGDRCLLLSDQGLTDIEGISALTVEDEGRARPITAIPRLHVFLNQNRISKLPDEIARLDNMVFLYMYDNELSELPTAIGGMGNLLGLYFTRNRFTEIPPFIFEMRQLKKLQFSENQIKSLPPEVGNLSRMIHFNLAKNQISAIPESISQLTRLRVCDLSDNPFTSLPEAFGQVSILYQLRVRNCPLTTLPAGFANMPATIDITGTRIDPAALSPALRARINTEKPPRTTPSPIIVRSPEK